MVTPRPRRTPTGQQWAADAVHVRTEDPDAPGCCKTCRRPLAVEHNHVDQPTDLPPAPPGPQDRAAGDLEDHDA